MSSFGVPGGNRNQPGPSSAMGCWSGISSYSVVFVFHFARALHIQPFATKAGSSWLRTTPISDDSKRLWATPDDARLHEVNYTAKWTIWKMKLLSDNASQQSDDVLYKQIMCTKSQLNTLNDFNIKQFVNFQPTIHHFLKLENVLFKKILLLSEFWKRMFSHLQPFIYICQILNLSNSSFRCIFHLV